LLHVFLFYIEFIIILFLFVFFFFFFFSSRRRHTRWPRDWSSDVCSSDLMRAMSGRDFARLLERHGWTLLRVSGSHHIYGKAGTEIGRASCRKECRYRWSEYH